MIQGTFGQSLDSVNESTNQPRNAAEAPYFVTWMGANYSPSSNRGHGWVTYGFVDTGDITVSTNFCRDREKPTSNFASCVVTPVYSDTFTVLGGTGGSVASGTLITMEGGNTVPVQNLVPGDRILLFDVFSRKSLPATIAAVRQVTVDNMLTIFTENGLPLRVDANPRLKFYVWTNTGPVLKPVTEFQPGDHLYSYDYGDWVPVAHVQVSYGGSHDYYDLLTNPYLNPDGQYLSFIANGYADPCTPVCKEGPSP